MPQRPAVPASSRTGGARAHDLRHNREAWTRVAAIALALVSFVVGASIGTALYGGLLIFVFALTFVHAASIVGALLLPRTAAVVGVLASFGIAVVAHSATGAAWPWAVTTMITQAIVIGIVAHRAGWVLATVTLLASVGFSWLAAFVIQPPHEQDSVAVNLVVFTSLAGGLLGVGVVWRQWQVIRSQLASERRLSEQERARRVIAEEKTRIARELHDVIAHSMSIINVQASSASARHPDVDAALQTEFEEIAAASRRALAEMRSLLSVLREQSASGELAPQPTLSRIPELVSQSGVHGTPVELIWTGSSSDEGVSDLVGLAAYRIVQEALSNVIRHGRGSSVEVRCDRGSDSIVIVVENSRPTGPVIGSGTDLQPGGQGLIGMRERAASVGGSIEFGPTSDGGYLVHAHLPLVPQEFTQEYES